MLSDVVAAIEAIDVEGLDESGLRELSEAILLYQNFLDDLVVKICEVTTQNDLD